MINLASSQALSYQYQGQTITIQVYKDNLDSNVYYILPQPIVEMGASGLPVFSMTEYDNGQAVTGQCNFQTVLQTPPGAVAAVQAKFPGAKIGAWEWSGGTAWFNYQYPNSSGQMQSFSDVAWPSLQPTAVSGQTAQASGQAAWSVSLPSQAAVQAFIAAFSGSAGGTFSVEYQMQVPGSLPGVDVTVSFNSQTAYSFQQKISVDKNVWGDVTKETVAINQHLQQSEAGTINIVWGAIDPKSSQGQQITNWANQTLQNQIRQAVDQTIALMKQNVPQGQDYTFSMNQVASFSTHYVQNQVVDWSAQSQTQLPAFSADVWKQLFSQVDTQPLTVVFALQNTSLQQNGISNVTVYLTSPSGNGSGVLTDLSSNWTFTKPAVSGTGGKPNLTYTFYYVVAYSDGTSWQSPSIDQDAAVSGQAYVTLSAGALKALAVSFQCTNVPFGSTPTDVDYVAVNFTFTNPAVAQGIGPQTVTQVLKFHDNESKEDVKFYTSLPYSSTYTYSVRYVLGDGTTIDMAPAAPTNQNIVLLNNPIIEQFVSLTIYWDKGLSNVQVAARWMDPNNTVSVAPKIWSIPNSSTVPDLWTLNVPNNPNANPQVVTSQYALNGKLIRQSTPWIPDGPFINISSTQSPFMVQIDPSLVDWTTYAMVSLNAYLLINGQIQQMKSFGIQKGMSLQYVTFLLDGSSPELNWYYAMTYIPIDNSQPSIKVPQTLCQYKMLILPAKVTKQTLLANSQIHLDPDKCARTLKAAHRHLWAPMVALGEPESINF